MMRLTIYTENLPDVPGIVARFFPSFSVQEQLGYWNGEPENSLAIVVLFDPATQPDVPDKANDCAKAICAECAQQAVLLETGAVTLRMVTGG